MDNKELIELLKKMFIAQQEFYCKNCTYDMSIQIDVDMYCDRYCEPISLAISKLQDIYKKPLNEILP